MVTLKKSSGVLISRMTGLKILRKIRMKPMKKATLKQPMKIFATAGFWKNEGVRELKMARVIPATTPMWKRTKVTRNVGSEISIGRQHGATGPD